MNRIAEAYVGEYGSGKSEAAVNRALGLAQAGRRVTLVDLDLTEPAYTLRPLRRELEAAGVELIAYQTAELNGLGETGIPLHPAARWALRREGDVIFDVGYGSGDALRLLEGGGELTVLLVVNGCRPQTAGVEQILTELARYERVDGLIANGHRGGDTTTADVLTTLALCREAARRGNLPLVAVCGEEAFLNQLGDEQTERRPLRRLMDKNIW